VASPALRSATTRLICRNATGSTRVRLNTSATNFGHEAILPVRHNFRLELAPGECGSGVAHGAAEHSFIASSRMSPRCYFL